MGGKIDLSSSTTNAMKNASFQTDTTTVSGNTGTVTYFDTNDLVLTTAPGQGLLSSVVPVAASSVVPSAATTSVVTVAGGTKGAVRMRAGTTGASTLDVNQAIKTTASGTATDGGSVLLQAGGAITLATTNGTITPRGTRRARVARSSFTTRARVLGTSRSTRTSPPRAGRPATAGW